MDSYFRDHFVCLDCSENYFLDVLDYKNKVWTFLFYFCQPLLHFEKHQNFLKAGHFQEKFLPKFVNHRLKLHNPSHASKQLANIQGNAIVFRLEDKRPRVLNGPLDRNCWARVCQSQRLENIRQKYSREFWCLGVRCLQKLFWVTTTITMGS